MQPENSSAVNAAPVKPGIRTTELWLLAGLLALIAGAVFAGPLNDRFGASAGVLIAAVMVRLYSAERVALKTAAAENPDDPLIGALTVALDALPAPTVQEACQLITTLQKRGGAAVARDAHNVEAVGSVPAPATLSTPPGSGAGVGLKADTAAERQRNIHGASGCSDVRALLGVVGVVLAACAAMLYLPACATDTGDPAKDRRGRVTNAALESAAIFAGKVVFASVQNAASQWQAGQDIDYAHAASAGLYANLDSIFSSADVNRIVTAYTGPALPGMGPMLAAKYDALAPGTAADRRAVVAALATGVSSAALSATTASGKNIVP